MPEMSAAVPWFGVVGLALGVVQGAMYVGLAEVSTPTLAAAISVAVLALITGAFHHDGLADVADAFGGGWTTEQRLEILKDSRLGTYGVTALVLVIVIEVAALAALAGWVALGAAAAAHTLGRCMATLMMTSVAPAKDSGLGVDYLTGLSRSRVLLTALLAFGATIVAFGVFGVAIIAAAYLAAVAVARLAVAKIGGISGDVLGAVQQIAKVAVLIAAVIVADAASDPGLLGGLVLS